MGEMLGMGIAIQLRNLFSAPAAAVITSSRALTQAITKDQNEALNGWKLMGAGAAMAFVGTGLLAFIGKIGEMSIKTSSQLEIFRMQIRLLSHDTNIGDSLFAQLKIFGAQTPFTIPQVMAGAKNLLAFGISSGKVMEQLRVAGNWAAAMNMPIDEAAMILGKVNSGAISFALRSLHRAGISSAAIRAEGGAIDAKGRTMAGADPAKFLEAVNRVIEKQFGGMMGGIMSTIPGMVSNMKDQFILMGAAIGDVISPQVKDVLHSILAIFDPKLVLPFARSVGEGLAFVLRETIALLTPIGHAIIAFMKFAGTHPGIMKLAFGVIAVTGAVLNLAGASLILFGIWTIIESILASEAAAAFFGGLWAAVPVVLAVAAAGVALYEAWTHNFMGLASRVDWFYERVRIMGHGVVELFANIRMGVGYMSIDTANALDKYGLLGVVVQLFMFGYRVYQFFLGVADAMRGFATVLGFVASVISLILTPLEIFAAFGLRVAQAFGFINLMGLTSSNMFQNMGRVVGTLLAGFVTYRAVVLASATAQAIWTGVIGIWNVITNASTYLLGLWNIATKAVTAAQWLWNAAMMANPIGLIVAGVAILGIGIYMLITHFHQITAWFTGLPGWAKFIMAVFVPFIYAPLWIMSNWNKVTSTFATVGHAIKDTVGSAVMWLIDKIEHLWNVLGTVPGWISSAYKKFDTVPITMNAPGYKPGEFTTPPNQRQTELLINSGRPAQDSHTLDSIHTELQKLNATMATPAPMAPVQLHVDGRVLARTVNTHNRNEAASGRGGH